MDPNGDHEEHYIAGPKELVETAVHVSKDAILHMNETGCEWLWKHDKSDGEYNNIHIYKQDYSDIEKVQAKCLVTISTILFLVELRHYQTI